MTISPEQIEILRRPFTPQAVKFRLDAKQAFGGKVRCVAYIDASLAADRIALVDPHWTSRLTKLGPAAEAFPMLCSLTVRDITREQVGQYATAAVDGKHAKSAASDAFKRAAAEFGVGVYLRTMPQFKVTEGEVWKSGNGKFGGINPGGLAQLRAQYQRAIADMAIVSRFGLPIDHGDYVREADDEPTTEAMEEAAALAGFTPEQTAILTAIAGACGHPFDPTDKLAEDYETIHLPKFLEYAVGRAKAIDSTVSEAVHAAAVELDVDTVQELVAKTAVSA